LIKFFVGPTTNHQLPEGIMNTTTPLLEAVLEATASPTTAEPPKAPPKDPERLLTDSAGIVWRVVDETTGLAERVTEVPGRPTTRKSIATTRFFPPAATTATPDHGIPLSVVGHVKEAMMKYLFEAHPGGADAVRRAIDAKYGDVALSVRTEVVDLYLSNPASLGPRGRR